MALRKVSTEQNKQQFTSDRLRVASDVGVKTGLQKRHKPGVHFYGPQVSPAREPRRSRRRVFRQR